MTTKWASLLAAVALTAPPCSAALVYYELNLTTDAPYTGFGGGSAGDIFIGTFGFDDSLLSSPGAVFEPVLSENAFFLNIDINGTTFSTESPGAQFERSALQFRENELVDIYFEIFNSNNDGVEAATDSSAGDSFWLAKESDTDEGPRGESVIFFAIIPEPSSAILTSLAALTLFQRRRSA